MPSVKMGSFDGLLWSNDACSECMVIAAQIDDDEEDEDDGDGGGGEDSLSSSINGGDGGNGKDGVMSSTNSRAVGSSGPGCEEDGMALGGGGE